MAPPDIDALDLPTQVLGKGAILQRVHRTALGPIHFGRGPTFRFDDPAGSYGVLYAAMTDRLAFAETLLRARGSLVARSEIEIRSICPIEVTEDVVLTRLHGPGLHALGADASATSGPYAASRLWSSAIHGHPSRPDGILYRGTRDNDEFAIALFERAAPKVAQGASVPLMDDPARLGAILDHYEAGLA